ncbi:hypothetical protein [Mycolicibacterium sp. 018/SC-01/001]|nr:hypothetical protein [Mycolicibacterium sp. 018/SC-01/001]
MVDMDAFAADGVVKIAGAAPRDVADAAREQLSTSSLPVRMAPGS